MHATTILLAGLLAAAQSPADKEKPAPAAGDDRPAAQKPALEDDLFDDLTGDLFEGLADPVEDDKDAGGGDDERPDPARQQGGEDLGGKQDPLAGIGREMREIESLIAKARTGEDTQKKQQEVVDQLAELIKQVAQQQKKQQQQNSQNKQQGKQGGQGTQAAKQAGQPRDSDDSLRKPELSPEELARRRADLLKKVWGQLPDGIRQRYLNNTSARNFLPGYEPLIEAYFKELAERYNQQGR